MQEIAGSAQVLLEWYERVKEYKKDFVLI